MMFGLFIPPFWQRHVLEHEKEVTRKVEEAGMRLCSYRLHDQRVLIAILKNYPALTEGLGEIRRLQGILQELTGLYFDILILTRFQ
jgi:hypothetical protein